MNSSIVSEKGWVVIPLELRKRYGLKKGVKVHVVDFSGIISIIPFSEDPIKNSKGMLKGKTSLLEALAQSRGEDA